MTHKNVSFAKSGLRILAGISIAYGNLVAGGLLLVLAELLGILEEVVEEK